MIEEVSGSAVEILLIRHAKSDWRFDAIEDSARPLNRRGLKDCVNFVPGLPARLPTPGLLLVSPAARTMQTGQALADAFDLAPQSLRVLPRLYEATVPTMLSELALLDRGAVSVQGAVPVTVAAVVAHNPGLNDLYTWATGQRIDNIPTSTLR